MTNISRTLSAVAYQLFSLYAIIATYQLSPTFKAMGTLGLINFLAIVIFSILAGEIADRVRNKRKVLIIILYSTTVLMLVLAVIQNQNLYLFFFITFFITALRVFRSPFYFIISKDIIHECQNKFIQCKKYILSWQISVIASPLIGGVVTLYFGPQVILYISLALLVLSSFFIPSIYVKRVKKTPSTLFQKYKNAFTFYCKNDLMGEVFWVDSIGVLFAGITALIPFLLKNLNVPMEHLGFIKSFQGIATLLFTVTVSRQLIQQYARKLFYTSIFFYILVTALAPSATALLSLYGIFFILGFLDGASIFIREYLLLSSSLLDNAGKVYSLNSIFITTSDELGEFESAFAANFLGLQTSILMGAGICFSIACYFLIKGSKATTSDKSFGILDESVH